MKKLIAALLFLPLLALAQDGVGENASRIKKKPAPAATTEEPAALITFTPFTPLADEPAPAPHACVSPPVSKAFASQKEADAFNAALTNFQACMKNYVEVHSKAANAHADVANKAVAEANAYIAEINSKLATDKK